MYVYTSSHLNNKINYDSSELINITIDSSAMLLDSQSLELIGDLEITSNTP